MKRIEQHSSGSDTVRDVVIGIADGLARIPHCSGVAIPLKAVLILRQPR
jgi:hypothetical protein